MWVDMRVAGFWISNHLLFIEDERRWPAGSVQGLGFTGEHPTEEIGRGKLLLEACWRRQPATMSAAARLELAGVGEAGRIGLGPVRPGWKRFGYGVVRNG